MDNHILSRGLKQQVHIFIQHRFDLSLQPLLQIETPCFENTDLSGLCIFLVKVRILYYASVIVEISHCLGADITQII